MPIINGIVITADIGEILTELRSQLSMQGITRFQKIVDSGEDFMTQCPYHKDGQERRPSAGIRKSDGMFHCFSGDTKVITREFGAAKIRDIVNQYVSILNGNGEWEFVRFENYGRQSLMRLTLSCNTKEKVIYATDKHEWIVHNYNTKYQTYKLKPGMYLEKCVPKLRTDIKLDPKGIIHGFCYGDGNNFSHNKDKSIYYNRCFFYNESDLELKQYFVGDFRREIAANGKEYDIVYFRSGRDLKKVPDLTEKDSYLLGFLAGYFVADGNCFNNKLTIYSHKYEDLYKIQQICTVLGIMTSEIGVSNIKAGKRGCITVKEDTNGYTLRLVRNTIPDNFFVTEKGRNSVQKYTGRQRYKVVKVERTDLEEYVYCCQTSTHSFALENFILTGNCLACGETKSLCEMISDCLGYNDPFGKQGYKWLVKNFSALEVEDRGELELDLDRSKVKSDYQSFYVSEEELDSYRYTHPYMYERGLTDEIIELFDIGYDKNTKSITFPVRYWGSANFGKCMFVARRQIKTKRFDIPMGIEKPLYGLYETWYASKGEYNIDISSTLTMKDIAVPYLDSVYVCEGLFDCLRLWCNGKFAVAGFGCLFSDYQIQQLEGLPTRHLILALDNDDAGRKATALLKQRIKNKLITEVVIPDGKKDIGECTDDEIKNLVEVL